MGWEGLVGFYSLKSLVPALFTGRMPSLRTPAKAEWRRFQSTVINSSSQYLWRHAR
jgi:hypothetical protein